MKPQTLPTFPDGKDERSGVARHSEQVERTSRANVSGLELIIVCHQRLKPPRQFDDVQPDEISLLADFGVAAG